VITERNIIKLKIKISSTADFVDGDELDIDRTPAGQRTIERTRQLREASPATVGR
jgi:hypothetical protein